MRVLKLRNGEEITIREATKTDAPNLIRHVKRVADETHYLTFSAHEFKKSIEEEEKIVENYLKSDNLLFILAEIEDKITGILHVNASHKIRLRHIGEFGITVVKTHWNKGIASHLIQYMIDWAKETKIIRKLNLEVQSDNTSAIRIYEKFGFEKEGTMRRGSFIDDQFYDVNLMGLLID